jgi:uncharacterized protein (UPF0147 family)
MNTDNIKEINRFNDILSILTFDSIVPKDVRFSTRDEAIECMNRLTSFGSEHE